MGDQSGAWPMCTSEDENVQKRLTVLVCGTSV
jgi:hypothetical protein